MRHANSALMTAAAPPRDPARKSPFGTRVVHCKTDAFTVYIGRANGALKDRGWGNPFVIGVHGTRDEVKTQYRAWLPTQPALMARLHELRGQTLGCWCKTRKNPDAWCHGDVLAELADSTLGNPPDAAQSAGR